MADVGVAPVLHGRDSGVGPDDDGAFRGRPAVRRPALHEVGAQTQRSPRGLRDAVDHRARRDGRPEQRVDIVLNDGWSRAGAHNAEESSGEEEGGDSHTQTGGARPQVGGAEGHRQERGGGKGYVRSGARKQSARKQSQRIPERQPSKGHGATSPAERGAGCARR